MHKTLQFMLAAVWAPLLFVMPVLSWGEGTSRNVSVRVLLEPYQESPELVYEWTGDVYRACPVRLERQIVDANGYVHLLVDKALPAPDAAPGPTTFTVRVETPKGLPSGPAEYLVTEWPACDWLQRKWPPAVDYPPVRFTVTN